MESNNKKKYHYHIGEWKKSGKKLSHYCRENVLNKSSFYYYMSSYGLEDGAVSSVEKFVSLPTLNYKSSTRVSIKFPKGAELCIDSILEESLLVKLINALS